MIVNGSGNDESRTYLLVGLTGHGKSTTGNVIINRNGELRDIMDTPFRTSDGASGCTGKFQTFNRGGIKIIDTVGFGDPQFSSFFHINLFYFI